ncbi:endoplasmic reticulum-Golgi intermediate compartment protein 2 isoform X3 [Eurosta solidaginis]|uniref:endoplasmic reticulum-Golgi intermediate compartment protein 2 isoform X3 n=1 Tax=Eurosta solidaginis TaxID=178769 RepID=UPI003530BA6E
MTATLRYRGDKNNLIELAKNLDAFKKVPEKYTETTEIGGTLSLLSRLLIIFLIYNEVCYYREASLVYQFEPDIDLDGKVQMHVDITVAMPCRSLSGVDLMDETQQDVFAYGTLQREGTWWALPEGERLQFERMQHMNTFLREEYHSVADILFKNIIKSKEVHAKSLQNVKSLPEEQYDACRLHGTLGLNKVFPFLFVLMTKKSLKAYQHLFSYIQRSIIDLSQATFITDYETGLRSAIEKSFPDSKMFGCWFHYCQALRRFITMKDKRLAQYIRQNKEASRIYHKFLSLSLLPGMHISDSFQLLTEDLGKLNALDRFKSFIKYFENQWMQKIDPHNFSVFDSEIRTTSAIEAYNGVIGKSIPKKATFFKFVAFLQMQEFEKVAGVLHLIGNYQPFVDIFEDHFLFDLRPITVNFTHRINRLSFGQYSGRIVQPLEGDEIVLADADTVIQYFLKIVPTEIHNTFTTIDTYQYSVTENVRQLDSAKNSYGSPGIYIKYDWSALKIIVRADHDNLVQFIIRLCSIIAGIIVISGILNTILVSLQRVTINTLAPPLIQQQSLKDTIRRSSSYDNAHHREVTKTPESNAINVDLLHDCAQAVNTKLISNNLINTANTMANSISLLDASIPYTTSAAATYVPIAGDDKQEK